MVYPSVSSNVPENRLYGFSRTLRGGINAGEKMDPEVIKAAKDALHEFQILPKRYQGLITYTKATTALETVIQKGETLTGDARNAALSTAAKLVHSFASGALLSQFDTELNQKKLEEEMRREK